MRHNWFRSHTVSYKIICMYDSPSSHRWSSSLPTLQFSFYLFRWISGTGLEDQQFIDIFGCVTIRKLKIRHARRQLGLVQLQLSFILYLNFILYEEPHTPHLFHLHTHHHHGHHHGSVRSLHRRCGRRGIFFIQEDNQDADWTNVRPRWLDWGDGNNLGCA